MESGGNIDAANVETLLQAISVVENEDPDNSNRPPPRRPSAKESNLAMLRLLYELDDLEEEKVLALVLLFTKWESRLIVEDNCFLYMGNDTSVSLFTQRMDGCTPEAFALSVLRHGGRAFDGIKIWLPEPVIVDNMVVFWSRRFAWYRENCRSKEVARSIYRRSMLRVQDLLPTGWLKNVLGDIVHEVSLRVRRVELGPTEHRVTARLLPLLTPGKQQLQYRLQLWNACHEKCTFYNRKMVEHELQVALWGTMDNDFNQLLGISAAREAFERKFPR